MNAMKTLFVAAILVAGLCGAYLFLTHNPETSTPPEAVGNWNNPLHISNAWVSPAARTAATSRPG